MYVITQERKGGHMSSEPDMTFNAFKRWFPPRLGSEVMSRNKERALDNVENAKQFRLEMHVNHNEKKKVNKSIPLKTAEFL